jgi:hypothetical protein
MDFTRAAKEPDMQVVLFRRLWTVNAVPKHLPKISNYGSSSFSFFLFPDFYFPISS